MNLKQKKQELSANTTLSHYRIFSKLGEGRTKTTEMKTNNKE